MIISRTPVRVSFCGGGTDIDDFSKSDASGGLVISTTISKYIHVTVNRRFDDNIRLSYSKMEMVDKVDDIQHGLIREALKLTGISSGVEITTIADIPSRGTGLGSSSAVTVGVLNALHRLEGRVVDSRRLAEEACKIEIECLREPIGRQDQYAAAYGGLNRIMFGTGGVTVEPIEIPNETLERMELELSLVYTNTTRSASAILSDVAFDSKQRKYNLVKIREQARDAERYLKKGDLTSLGVLLGKSWEIKRGLSHSVTNDYLDSLYTRIIDLGASGGKLLGAGGGGFFLVQGDQSLRSRLVESLPRENRVIPFQIDHKGSEIINH